MSADPDRRTKTVEYEGLVPVRTEQISERIDRCQIQSGPRVMMLVIGSEPRGDETWVIAAFTVPESMEPTEAQKLAWLEAYYRRPKS